MSEPESVTRRLTGRGSRESAARVIGGGAIWATLSLSVTAAILIHFHDRTWWPPDEGVYGYVAQRILAGDVLNGNLQDLHAGYVNFLHAGALWLFGEDLVSLRYPLAALTLLQSALAFRLLLPRGPLYAAIGTVALGALSFVLFLNPSANWYVLAVAFATVTLLAETAPGDRRREVAVGALLGVAFLLRQLSGVFLAIGVVTWLLAESASPSPGKCRVARTLLGVMGLAVAVYLWRKGSVDGVVMFGIWPLVLIGIALVRTRLDDSHALALVARLALGAALAALPILAYHLAHGTLGGWIEDALLSALHLTSLDFIDRARYWHVAVLAAGNLAQLQDPIRIANSLFWLVLLAAPAVLGLSMATAAFRGRLEQAWHPLPVVAVFYALCSTHYEIPIYLQFTTGLGLIALMWLAGAQVSQRRLFGATALFAAVIALLFQAGQPVSRGLGGIIAGATPPLDAPEGLPGARFAMERQDQATYLRLLALIEANSEAGEAILAVPFDPELYFLSHRRSPFRYYATMLGIRDDDALAEALQRLERSPPPIVIHKRDDKYNNWASDAVVAKVRDGYVQSERVGPFDVYLLPAGSSGTTRSSRPAETRLAGPAIGSAAAASLPRISSPDTAQ